MNIFETVTMAVIKRPFIIIMIGALTFIAAVANAFIPVIAMIMGIINMTGGNVFEGMLSVLQMLIDPAVIPIVLGILAILALLGAIVVGLLLPGYLLIVNDGLVSGEKKQGMFIEGLKTNFLRVSFITVKTVLITFLLGLFLMVAGVPAIVVTKAAATTRPNLMLAAIFIDILTVSVVFMSLSFFKAYIYMWYIAAVNGLPRPFKAGKAAADCSFWRLAFGLLLFDIIFAAVIFTIYLSDIQLFRYIAGWIFTTGFFTTLAVYLVRHFNENYKEKPEKLEAAEQSRGNNNP